VTVVQQEHSVLLQDQLVQAAQPGITLIAEIHHALIALQDTIAQAQVHHQSDAGEVTTATEETLLALHVQQVQLAPTVKPPPSFDPQDSIQMLKLSKLLKIHYFCSPTYEEDISLNLFF
jgi:hypothetical protein